MDTAADGRPHRVSAVGLDPRVLAGLARLGPAERGRALSVHTGPSARTDLPAVAGSHVVDEEGLHFLPHFPFVSGVRYTARLAVGAIRRERAFEVAGPQGGDPPRVVAVHPSGETLPENTLRLYVHFSRPMTAHQASRHVRLVTSDGRNVPLAFVEVKNGLWDARQTRLTLLFHPGRVKRGVAPGELLGPPLRAGREYRLVIDGSMSDVGGVPLGRDHEHAFRAGEADRASPRLADVGVEPPTSPHGPVTMLLREPLDHALLQRWVWVEDGLGRPIAGRVEVEDGERRWSFHPEHPWTPGRFAVRLRAAVEDRAGNRFDRLFDREAAGVPGASPEAADTVFDVPFQVP